MTEFKVGQEQRTAFWTSPEMNSALKCGGGDTMEDKTAPKEIDWEKPCQWMPDEIRIDVIKVLDDAVFIRHGNGHYEILDLAGTPIESDYGHVENIGSKKFKCWIHVYDDTNELAAFRTTNKKQSESWLESFPDTVARKLIEIEYEEGEGL